ncbi:M12 family metallopeptidase [Pseudomonas frederiksbergensis]|uniref:M12 family metallopeptidase n=1 Tax=Pseudomonas frederiksbergensis TaxID=104087 RepID=UPI000F495B3A|nr:M12 family metallopeptidase [Pseudomonas frederiksbergensis]
MNTCKVIKPDNPIASYESAIAENPLNGNTVSHSGRHKRSVGQWNKFWGNGRTLNITFINEAPEDIKKTIEKIIRQWEPSTNLTFTFNDAAKGDIRIKTDAQTNESYVGTDATLAPELEPTLRLAVDCEDPDFELTVLHEFGHALGLQHEHQHPKANIPWDKPKVYEFYKDNFQWTEEEVDGNLFSSLSTDLLLGPYDKDSIMHYVVDNELTLGDWEVRRNTRISKLDRRNMRKAYPKPGNSPL